MGILRSWGRWIGARVAGEVLDVGCGDDGLLALLEREGHRVVDVDTERAGDLPFEDGSFDTVLFGDFLASWASRERPLAEARRVLRPGGRLIVTVPYHAAGAGEGEERPSLEQLVEELSEVSVKEIAAVGGRLCLLAQRSREKSRATVWRQALRVAEQRLGESEEALAARVAALAELEASREREERALADSRGDVARLETALAAATHRRDLEQEKARLAADGVAQLEARLERSKRDAEGLKRDAERKRAEVERKSAEAEREHEQAIAEVEREHEQAIGEAERERAEVERKSAEAEREHEQAIAEAGGKLTEAERQAEREMAEAERSLADARARLETREEELERSRGAVQEADRELAAVREKLSEKDRELVARQGDAAAAKNALAERQRELAAVREEVRARRGELDLARQQLADRVRELDAAGVLLETQGAELAQAREAASRAGEAADAAVREREEARTRLEAREKHLKTAQLGVESRDRRLEVTERKVEAADGKLEAADRALASRDSELERLRAAARDRERRLALAEARLEKAQQRADCFRGSLVELREGRAYRLMRVLWRLRRPFRRAPRDASPAEAPAGDDPDSAPPAPDLSAPPAAPPAAPRIAIEERQPPVPPRQPGEQMRVASILDEMSEACFAPECNLLPLSLDGWREQLDERRPDLLLVESAWNANGGEWQYRIAQYPRKDLVGLPALRALLAGCRERGIPTAFWNKEDPVHFDRFAEAAALFDHVFTTDARCVERYRALPGERTVTPLPFAAQPRIHNPVAAVPERSSSPCFAGAWYRDRHPDRRRALAALLDAARPYGLVIYDRSFDGKDGAFGFPERFAPHVLGKLPYEDILDVYKSHRVFLNANSVVDSPTMCSRRVFELAACDTAILSTPGAALAALLGEGVVGEPDGEEAATAELERLLGDEPERRRRTRAARRAVFTEHTYAERLATIADTAGLDASSLRREPFAAPGTSSNGSGAAANGAGEDQPWRLVLQGGVGLSAAALADLSAAARFAEADVIGVAAANGGSPAEHRRVRELDPRALLLRRELIADRGAPPTGSLEQIGAQLRAWSDEGVRLYAADADLLSPLIAAPADF